jgi:hypothetical protein
MKKTIIKGLLLAFATTLTLALHTNSASAAFNPSHVMDDHIFNNSSSMSVAQIDAFLNQFPSSCISTNRGFSAIDPIGYSPGTSFTFGGNVTAGTVIGHAAQAYDLNPQVLLALLQKEQSLVTGTAGCSSKRYVGATGYGCNGSEFNYSGLNLYTLNGVTVTSITGACPNTAAKAGFSQQVIRAAWGLKFGQQRSLGNVGWAIIRGNWDNSDDPQSCYSGPMTSGSYKVCPNGPTTFYDGYRTIEGTATFMGTGATASFYRYTPSFHSQQLITSIWESWWGSSMIGTYRWATGGYAIMNEAKTTYVDPGQLLPGETYVAILQAVNTGTATWQKGGPNPVVLATNGPTSRNSSLCRNTWIACNRPANLKETTVAPAEIGHFEFTFQAPYRLGLHAESFKPVAEMLSWFNDSPPYDSFGIWVVSPGTYSWAANGYVIRDKSSAVVQAGSLKPGEKYDVTLTATNTGTATWKNSGPIKVNLAKSNPTSQTSMFCSSTWMSCLRPTTLQEASVAPGQQGHFVFEIQAPFKVGPFREYFRPVAEMFTWFNETDENGAFGGWTVAGTYTWSTTGFIVKNLSNQQVNPSQLQAGQTYTATIDALNTGTATWTNSGPTPIHLAASNPTSRSSSLCHNTWIGSGCNRPSLLTESSVAPGQTGHFTFTFQAGSPGTYREWFKPVAENLSWFNDAPYNELGIQTTP